MSVYKCITTDPASYFHNLVNPAVQLVLVLRTTCSLVLVCSEHPSSFLMKGCMH